MTKNLIQKNKGSHFIKSRLTYLKCSPEYSKGALLLELLVVISILGIILAVGANATFLSLRGNKTSGENGVATSLATEAFEAVRSIVEEDYQNIYGLALKGPSNHYYPTSTYVAGKWSLRPTVVLADEQVVMNGITYTRYVTIDNVSRDDSTRNIQVSYLSDYDDPSTQKVTVTVSWNEVNSIVMSEYFFRWKNKTCGQSGWAAGGSGDTVKGCADVSYDTVDSNIIIASGTDMSLALPCGTYTVVGPDSLTYGTVLGADGKCWLDRNLGATRVAIAFNDASAYGYYYQWGRGYDGHQVGTSGTTTTLSSSDTPGNANFIKISTGIRDWRSPQNNSLWQGINGTNNPCPVGFRVPTQPEFATLISSSSITNSATAYSSALKLTISGGRSESTASIDLPDSGFYWSSSVSGTDASDLYFNATTVLPADASYRGGGFIVRCVKD